MATVAGGPFRATCGCELRRKAVGTLVLVNRMPHPVPARSIPETGASQQVSPSSFKEPEAHAWGGPEMEASPRRSLWAGVPPLSLQSRLCRLEPAQPGCQP